ncbi:hypothetical protein ACQ4LE_002640 [Meloidogyne hapla]|uniref:Myosin motor domain-containing protein n=1 Tax=Meloidogyne hapla TaxID=6305 RepID=A0A1I8AZP1_MELHA
MGLLKFDEVQKQVKRWLAAAKDKYGYNLFVKWAAKTFHRYDRRLFLQTELIKKLNAQISARDEEMEEMAKEIKQKEKEFAKLLNEKEEEINKLRKKAGAGEDKQQEQSTSKDPEKKKKMNKGKRISQVTREKRKKAKMVEAEGRN